MTGMDQVEHGLAGYQGYDGGDPIQGLGQHTGFIGGLLISAGAVISLAMAVTKVRRLNLWLIPTALYVAGVILVAMPHQKD
jgi:hypothetical protein